MPAGLPYFNQGQSGIDAPAGILSPLELPFGSNLKCWYDINQETGFSDGDVLTTLTNHISGAPANSHFSSLKTPRYETNELDEEPVVEFSLAEADKFVTSDALFFEFMHKQASSLLCIFKPEDHTFDTVYHMINNNHFGATNRGFNLTGKDDGELQLRIGNGTVNEISLISSTGILSFGTWYIAFMRQSGDGGDATLYLDNISVATDATITALNSGAAFSVCKIAIRSASDSDEFGGQISQILAWDADVESDRQALHDYFADRFPTLNL